MRTSMYQIKAALLEDVLGPGEFTLADKLQPYEYIQDRAKTLAELHQQNPELARKVVSLVYPHKAGRMWSSSELEERLKLPALAQAAKQAAYDAAYKYAPSLASAYDAFQQSRAMQAQIEEAQQAQAFPALHATQPTMVRMQQQALYGMDPTSLPNFDTPPVHHRHRRHRSIT